MARGQRARVLSRVGREFWSRRPMNGSWGRWAKTVTHRIERLRAKAEVRKNSAPE